MRSSRINGEGELRGQLANPGLPRKMAIKTVYVCICVYACVYMCALFTQVTDADSEWKFRQSLTELLEEHREVVTLLAEGFTDCRRHIQV